jgi:hypothetical protein
MIQPEAFDAIAAKAGLRRDPASCRKRIEAMETLLERAFVVPGLKHPVGLDAIIGLIPVVGDIAAAAMGAYMVWEARNLGMSKWQMTRMFGNIAVDTALGAIPLVGDVFDFAFRSNTRNLRIIRRHLDRHHPGTATVEGVSRPAR